jgi:3-deoxy-D-manno-octulosonic-acid transferase
MTTFTSVWQIDMFLYNFFLTLGFLFALPYFFHRFRGTERDFRFGNIHFKCTGGSIWIHAASVGEVNAVKPLILGLKEKYKGKKIVISTVTATGYEAALKIHPGVAVIIFPFDIKLIMNRVFNLLKPEVILLAEKEFWPNMLLIARKRRVPVILVNAGMTEKSFDKYRRTIFFWRRLWRAISAVNAQSKLDAFRYKELGFKNISVTRNLKFCVHLPIFENAREDFHLKEADFVIVWGSSRPKEEWLFRSIIASLKDKIPNLKAIIVPRHLNRLDAIREVFQNEDSQLLSSQNRSAEYLIADKMGVLVKAYSIADIAIVGGSFYEYGGHNPLEPAFYNVPIIMGTHHSHCQDSVDKLRGNAGIIISERKKLAQNVLNLYNDKAVAIKLGRNAKQTLLENADSTEKNIEIIAEYL